jgi:ribosome-associated translation inhibitor RaiA
MIFHFQTGSVTFFEEDQAYYEAKLSHLKKLLGSLAGDADTVDVRVTLEKNKHSSGDKFEASATVKAPKHAAFHSDVTGDTIKHCADKLEEKLKAQITKFHEKALKH